MATTLKFVVSRRKPIDWERIAIMCGLIIYALVTDVAVLALIVRVFKFVTTGR